MPFFEPVSDFRIIASAASGFTTLTGSTSETVLATATLPANSMGPNGVVRVTYAMTNNNTADDKIIRIKLGGIGGTTHAIATQTTVLGTRGQAEIHNAGATNSQIAFPGGNGHWGPSSTAITTSAIDTTAAVDVVLTGQLEAGADNIVLRYFMVEVAYRP